MKQETKQNKLGHDYFEKKNSKILKLIFIQSILVSLVLIVPYHRLFLTGGSNFNKISWSREVNIQVA